jgi:hypothetical protein
VLYADGAQRPPGSTPGTSRCAPPTELPPRRPRDDLRPARGEAGSRAGPLYAVRGRSWADDLGGQKVARAQRGDPPARPKGEPYRRASTHYGDLLSARTTSGRRAPPAAHGTAGSRTGPTRRLMLQEVGPAGGRGRYGLGHTRPGGVASRSTTGGQQPTVGWVVMSGSDCLESPKLVACVQHAAVVLPVTPADRGGTAEGRATFRRSSQGAGDREGGPTLGTRSDADIGWHWGLLSEGEAARYSGPGVVVVGQEVEPPRGRLRTQGTAL